MVVTLIHTGEKNLYVGVKLMSTTEGAADGVMMMRKAKIDTSAPFRSVQEAVLLFGESIMAGQVYAENLK